MQDAKARSALSTAATSVVSRLLCPMALILLAWVLVQQQLPLWHHPAPHILELIALLTQVPV